MRLRLFQYITFAVLSCISLSSCEKLQKFLPKPPSVAEKIEAVPQEPVSDPTLNDPSIYAPEEEIPVAKVPEFELNKSSLVSILCYHDFHETHSRNDMTITAAAFRNQLQALKDANIAVVPMSDVVAWKQGKKNLPDEAVVISMDDGWLGVYQVAFPILKEFGYPFTLYLYKNYINSGGRTLNLSQIREMMANGAELGSHSVSHQSMASRKGRTPEQHIEWVKSELNDSKQFLENTFNVPIQTFAYPYGSKTDEIAKMTLEAGYDIAVTVNPQKATWDTENGVVPRFVILGDTLGNFKIATSFRGMGANLADSKMIKNDATDEQGNKLISLSPAPNSVIGSRLPLISVDTSKLGDVIHESIQMRIGGFGVVPAQYDPETKVLSYQLRHRLRLETCNVAVKFKRTGAEKDDFIAWEFKVDQDQAYKTSLTFPKPEAVSADPPPTPEVRSK